MNVLITSISRKVSLIKGVRRALDKLEEGGGIIGADSNSLCIGRFFVDEFWHMPPLATFSIETFLDCCRSYHIRAIIPTRDGELPFFASHREYFSQQGMLPMISSLQSLEIARDKWEFFKQLTTIGYSTVPTAQLLDDLEGNSFVVKERFGAGGRKMGLKLTRKEAMRHGKKLENPLYQPYLPGKEISVDLYVDRLGHCKGTVLRWREWIVNGESQITSTFRDPALEEQCSQLVEKLKLYGHVMFQLIRREDTGEDVFLECNPRFGGASSLSLATGLDSFYWFLIEASGYSLKTHPFRRALKNKQLVRYPEDLIQTQSLLQNSGLTDF